jgi:threonine/homoserine/homoserine lactone efflux protein
LRTVFATGFFSAALNPKPGLFVLAFIPQFVSPARGSVTLQMLGYGIWLALISAVVFALMGVFASRLSSWLRTRPRVVTRLNVGAGLTFVASGLSIVALKQK